MEFYSEQIEAYIKSKEGAWSQTTSQSERARLQSAFARYGNLINSPRDLASYSQSHLKPYSQKTLFIRLSAFYAWLKDNKQVAENPYARFLKDNARLFKNAYVPERLPFTFDEAYSRCMQIPDPNTRAAATALLHTGMRISEIQGLSGDSTLGKGAKTRRVFYSGPINSIQEVSQSAIRRALKSVGLKPHQLRKLFATRLVERGAKEADLLKIMGWSSIVTASSYLQPKRDEELQRMIREAVL